MCIRLNGEQADKTARNRQLGRFGLWRHLSCWSFMKENRMIWERLSPKDQQINLDIAKGFPLFTNLVSVNVESLVREGYLTREKSPDDRRKIRLVCTEKAAPVVERGRQLQSQFAGEMFQNVDERQKEAFFQVLCTLEDNLKKMRKELR